MAFELAQPHQGIKAGRLRLLAVPKERLKAIAVALDRIEVRLKIIRGEGTHSIGIVNNSPLAASDRYNEFMLDWMNELSVLLDAEFRARRVVATLATVGLDGAPRARMVFVRHLDAETGEIRFTTDARSQKVAELARQPMAELVFWTPHERVQVRVRGPMGIVPEASAINDQWAELREASRALFFWPPPGEPRHKDELFPKTVAADAPPPETFIVLAMHPTEVECLELNDSPHRRRKWSAVEHWMPHLLNP